MEETTCGICGDLLNEKYTHTLNCNHTFHYECIMKTFQYNKKLYNQCPLCRQPSGLLPLVNSLPKLIKGIHYYDNYPPHYESTKCQQILKSGKRKGCECGLTCMLGLNVCKRHHKFKPQTN